MHTRRPVSRRRFLKTASALTVGAPTAFSFSCAGAHQSPIVLENDFARYVIGADGRNRSFIDKRTGKDHCLRDPVTTFLTLRKDGKTYLPSRCSRSADKVTTEFAEARVTVASRLKVDRVISPSR